jgi:preprotein translocase subunit SecD
MNRTPLWKNLLLALIVALGVLYSMPNLYMPDAAVQISGENSRQTMSDNLLKATLSSLDKAGIAYKGTEKTDKSLLVRLESKDQQLKAKKAIEMAFHEAGLEYVVALNLAPTTPSWLTAIGAQPMKLGLDLSGGVHFLLEVDTEFAVNKRLESYKSEIKKLLREEKIRGFITDKPMMIVGKFSSEELRDKALSLVNDEVSDLTAEKVDNAEGFWVHWTMGEALQKKIASEAVSQNLVALSNRVNELGVSEPIVQRQGEGRIVVQLPGVQDSSTAKRIIGKTASLEFRLESNGKTAAEDFNFRESNGRREKASLERMIVISGDQVSNANTSFDEGGRPQVNITLDSQGGNLMHAATKNNVGRKLGVLFIERKYTTSSKVDEETGKKVLVKVPYYQKEVISLATIQSALGIQFRITGLDSQQEAQDLALLLRAGALAAPVDFVEERTIGPSLGKENIALGFQAILWGTILVFFFMMFKYRVFGITANLALMLNICLLIAVMSVLSATLTLPGMAGIVLTVGMAVDANVLIYERIREELKNGARPQEAISSGYDRAFVTILDANLTTLIVAVILFAMGSGPVKGFAVTLSIGILTSMYTAIVGSRAVINLIYGNRNVTKLAI